MWEDAGSNPAGPVPFRPASRGRSASAPWCEVRDRLFPPASTPSAAPSGRPTGTARPGQGARGHVALRGRPGGLGGMGGDPRARHDRCVLLRGATGPQKDPTHRCARTDGNVPTAAGSASAGEARGREGYRRPDDGVGSFQGLPREPRCDLGRRKSAQTAGEPKEHPPRMHGNHPPTPATLLLDATTSAHGGPHELAARVGHPRGTERSEYRRGSPYGGALAYLRRSDRGAPLTCTNTWKVIHFRVTLPRSE